MIYIYIFMKCLWLWFPFMILWIIRPFEHISTYRNHSYLYLIHKGSWRLLTATGLGSCLRFHGGAGVNIQLWWCDTTGPTGVSGFYRNSVSRTYSPATRSWPSIWSTCLSHDPERGGRSTKKMVLHGFATDNNCLWPQFPEWLPFQPYLGTIRSLRGCHWWWVDHFRPGVRVKVVPQISQLKTSDLRIRFKSMENQHWS